MTCHKSTSLYNEIRNNMPFLFLPERRTLLSRHEKLVLPIDAITKFASPTHATLLNVMSKETHDYNKTLIKQNQIMILHLDEINIKARYFFHN